MKGKRNPWAKDLAAPKWRPRVIPDKRLKLLDEQTKEQHDE